MTRKKVLILLGSVCLALMLAIPLVASCAGPAPTPTLAPTPTPTPEQETYEWRMQYLQGPLYSYYSEHFAENVREMSGGRINIEVFATDVLVPMDEVMAMTGRGMLDGTTFGYGGYWIDEIDVGAIEGGLPLSWRRAFEVDVYFYELGFLELCREAYAEQNVFYLTHLCGDPYELYVNTPIENLDDLRQLKIRASPGSAAEVYAELGIATEYLSYSEMYTGLATGVVDGSIGGGAMEILGYKVYEVAPYFVVPPVVDPSVGDVFINLDIWKSLSDEDKAIVEVAAMEYNRWMRMTFMEGEVRALAEMKKLGLVTCMLPEEDLLEMTAAAARIWDREGEKSPRCVEALRILKEWMVVLGYLAE